MGHKYEQNKERRIEVAKQICTLYAKRRYSLATCCNVFGIPYITFNQWAQPSLTAEDICLSRYRRGFVIEVNQMYIKAISEPCKRPIPLLPNKKKLAVLLKAKSDPDIFQNQKQLNSYVKTLCLMVHLL